MTGEQATTLVGYLKAAYPQRPIERATVEVYADALSDLEYEDARTAVYELVATSPYFPTIAAIREAVAERTLRLPTEGEALEQLAAWLREEGHAPPHPLVRRAAESVCDRYMWRTTDRLSVITGQFRAAYGSLRERELRRAMAPRRIAQPELPRATVENQLVRDRIGTLARNLHGSEGWEDQVRDATDRAGLEQDFADEVIVAVREMNEEPV